MKTAGRQEQYIELTREYPHGSHVAFDSESASLEGHYGDELSSFRARKVWVDILETQFLLEKDHDFSMAIEGSIEEASYILRCTFHTACGRYAFWRLTNSQAPEAQYTIETAHIPNAESLYEQVVHAPDLQQKKETDIYEIDDPFLNLKGPSRTSMIEWLKTLIRR